MKKPLKLLLIGAGPWGKNILRDIERTPGLELAAICTAQSDVSHLVSTDCACFHDWRQAMAVPGLDGVVIACPLSLHAEILEHAIHNKLPSLVEKPLTQDTAEAQRLQQLAQDQQTPVLINYIQLFNPIYLALKAHGEKLGTPILLRSLTGNQGPDRADCGALWDYGSHDVALALDLFAGRPQSIDAKGEALEGQNGNYNIHLQFAKGQAFIHTGNRRLKKLQRYEVFYPKHVIIFDHLSPTPLQVCETRSEEGCSIPQIVEQSAQALEFIQTSALENSLACFAEAIRGTRKAEPGLAECAAVTEILSCVTQLTATEQQGLPALPGTSEA